MTMPLKVVDISSDNPHPIDWHAVKASGVVALIEKVSEGTDYVDPVAEGDIAGARAAGLLVAAYHFLHPTESAATQVSLFAAHLYGCHMAVVDSEYSVNADPTDWSMTPAQWASVASVTKGVLDGISSHVNRRMLYGSPGFTPNMMGAPWNLPWWAAAYGSRQPSGSTLWQYTDVGSCPGIQGDVDLSYFNGTEAQLAALFGCPQPPSEDHVGQRLVQDPNSGAYWLVVDDRKAGVPDPTALATLKAEGIPTVSMTEAELNELTTVQWGEI